MLIQDVQPRCCVGGFLCCRAGDQRNQHSRWVCLQQEQDLTPIDAVVELLEGSRPGSFKLRFAGTGGYMDAHRYTQQDKRNAASTYVLAHDDLPTLERAQASSWAGDWVFEEASDGYLIKLASAHHSVPGGTYLDCHLSKNSDRVRNLPNEYSAWVLVHGKVPPDRSSWCGTWQIVPV